jgi:hypothetical protein
LVYWSTLETKNRVLLGDFIKISYARPVLPDLRAADQPEGSARALSSQSGRTRKIFSVAMAMAVDMTEFTDDQLHDISAV